MQGLIKGCEEAASRRAMSRNRRYSSAERRRLREAAMGVYSGEEGVVAGFSPEAASEDSGLEGSMCADLFVTEDFGCTTSMQRNCRL